MVTVAQFIQSYSKLREEMAKHTSHPKLPNNYAELLQMENTKALVYLDEAIDALSQLGNNTELTAEHLKPLCSLFEDRWKIIKHTYADYTQQKNETNTLYENTAKLMSTILQKHWLFILIPTLSPTLVIPTDLQPLEEYIISDDETKLMPARAIVEELLARYALSGGQANPYYEEDKNARTHYLTPKEIECLAPAVERLTGIAQETNEKFHNKLQHNLFLRCNSLDDIITALKTLEPGYTKLTVFKKTKPILDKYLKSLADVKKIYSVIPANDRGATEYLFQYIEPLLTSTSAFAEALAFLSKEDKQIFLKRNHAKLLGFITSIADAQSIISATTLPYIHEKVKELTTDLQTYKALNESSEKNSAQSSKDDCEIFYWLDQHITGMVKTPDDFRLVHSTLKSDKTRTNRTPNSSYRTGNVIDKSNKQLFVELLIKSITEQVQNIDSLTQDKLDELKELIIEFKCTYKSATFNLQQFAHQLYNPKCQDFVFVSFADELEKSTRNLDEFCMIARHFTGAKLATLAMLIKPRIEYFDLYQIAKLARIPEILQYIDFSTRLNAIRPGDYQIREVLWKIEDKPARHALGTLLQPFISVGYVHTPDLFNSLPGLIGDEAKAILDKRVKDASIAAQQPPKEPERDKRKEHSPLLFTLPKVNKNDRASTPASKP